MNCPTCNKEVRGTRANTYHYKESGLSRVYLSGAVTYSCVCGTKFFHIPLIERLHVTIAYNLLKKQSLLVGEEFRFLRKWTGLTIKELAALIGVTRKTISECENKGQISPHSDHLLRMLVMRIKEEACKQQMFQEIAIHALFDKMKLGPSKPEKMTIDHYTLVNLPIPSSQQTHLELTGVE